MALGDHLYVHRGHYCHHAIDCGDGHVIDYSSETGKEQDAKVRLYPVSQFAPDGKFEVVRYGWSYPPQEVVKRALSKLHEARYDLVLNNCEHFATWCKVGEPISYQVVRVVMLHGLWGGFLVFVALSAALVAWAGEPGLRGNQRTTGLAYWGNGSAGLGLLLLLGVSLVGALLGCLLSGWLWQRNKRVWYGCNVVAVIAALVSAVLASFVAGAHWDDEAMAELRRALAVHDASQEISRLEPLALTGRTMDRQTLAAYRRSHPKRWDRSAGTVYLQAVGDDSDPSEQLLDECASFLEAYYGFPVKRLPRVPSSQIPEDAWRVHPQWGCRQALDRSILDIPTRLPADALWVIRVTRAGMWTDQRDWNFASTSSRSSDRRSVVSLNYYGMPAKDSTEDLARALKLCLSVSSWWFIEAPCDSPSCPFSNFMSIPELDKHSLCCCPECEQKVWWSCPVDPVERYENLALFASRHNLDQYGVVWYRASQALRASGVFSR